jgi:hypothetical protein
LILASETLRDRQWRSFFPDRGESKNSSTAEAARAS